MSTTAEQLRAKGFVEQADGSFAKIQTVGKLHVGIITRSSAGGVDESHSSNPRTPRQPVAHKDERELQEQIANWLRLHDTWFTRSRMDRKTSNTVGCPDFLCAIAGMPVAIECKMPGNDLTPEQEQVRLKMTANGWQYWKVYRLEEVVQGIQAIHEPQP